VGRAQPRDQVPSGAGAQPPGRAATRLALAPGSRWHGQRWQFPGFVIELRRELGQWEPFTFAQLLGLHMEAQRHRHRREAITGQHLLAAVQATRGRPLRERVRALWAVRAETGGLLTPNEALNTPEARARAERIGDALLVYYLRRELRRLQAAQQTV
jgi:hypothetical protein